MILNSRDKAIIEFVSNCPTRSDIIERTFFPSLSTCQRRLKLLVEYDFIKRTRDYASQYYIYYVGKKPQQTEHCFQTSFFYSNLILEGKEIVKFAINKPISSNIISDALIGIREDNKIRVVLLEVEISSNNISKKIKNYEEFFTSGEAEEVFACIPELVFITNKIISSKDIEIKKIKPFKI